jgi:hypothetical protein
LPIESINIILVLFWLLSLFFIYYMIFSKQNEKKSGKSRIRKKGTYHR